MTKHTPGPWYIGDVNTDPDSGVLGEVAIMAKDAASHTGVRCPAVALPFLPLSIGAPIAMANARLIAAAPDLRAALVNLVNAYADTIRGDEPPCLIEARAALAQAAPAEAADDAAPLVEWRG